MKHYMSQTTNFHITMVKYLMVIFLSTLPILTSFLSNHHHIYSEQQI